MSLFCIKTDHDFFWPKKYPNSHLGLGYQPSSLKVLPWSNHSGGLWGLLPISPDDALTFVPLGNSWVSFKHHFQLETLPHTLCRSRFNCFLLYKSRALNNSLVLTRTFGCQFWKSSLTDLSHKLGFIHSGCQTAQGLGLRVTETRASDHIRDFPSSNCLCGAEMIDTDFSRFASIHTWNQRRKKLFPTNSSYKISDKAF